MMKNKTPSVDYCYCLYKLEIVCLNQSINIINCFFFNLRHLADFLKTKMVVFQTAGGPSQHHGKKATIPSQDQLREIILDTESWIEKENGREKEREIEKESGKEREIIEGKNRGKRKRWKFQGENQKMPGTCFYDK